MPEKKKICYITVILLSTLTLVCSVCFGLFFFMNNKIQEGKIDSTVYPDIVRVSSSGPAAELYPDSLGEYRRSGETHNNLPVYQHSSLDKYIVNMGKFNSPINY